jgi:uncharacterized protein (TIGR00369 family)
VCGHPRVLHGGAIAALLDDVMGILFLSRGTTGFTANLSVDYRRPIAAGTELHVSCSVDRVETARSGASKTYVKAVVSGAAGDPSAAVVFTEATALFISKPVSQSMLDEKKGKGREEGAPAAAEAAAPVVPVAVAAAAVLAAAAQPQPQQPPQLHQ